MISPPSAPSSRPTPMRVYCGQRFSIQRTWSMSPSWSPMTAGFSVSIKASTALRRFSQRSGPSVRAMPLWRILKLMSATSSAVGAGATVRRLGAHETVPISRASTRSGRKNSLVMDAKAFGLRTNIGYFFEAAAFSIRKLRPQRYARRENANKFAFTFAYSYFGFALDTLARQNASKQVFVLGLFVSLASPKILPLGKMQASLLLPSLNRIFDSVLDTFASAMLK